MITFSNLGRLGRLGNQFFQVASTIGIAKKNNHEYSFPEWLVNKFLKNPIPTGFQNSDIQLKETGCTYQEFDLECEGNVSIDLTGYFQSEKYFKHCEDAIRKYLTPSDALVEKIERKYGSLFAGNRDIASVHVRCGDYESLRRVYYNLNKDYFMQGIEESKAEQVIFFSDNIRRCKDVFKENDNNFLFLSERVHDNSLILDTKSAELDAPKHFEEDLIELFVMSRCRTNIISNSTYGWWAAWLNDNENKQVFAPNEWFQPEHLDLICKEEKRDNYLNDIIPESWKKR